MEKIMEKEGLPKNFQEWTRQTDIHGETILGLGYYLIYMVYLTVFVDFETEITHWITLVLLPLGLLYGVQRKLLSPPSLKRTFSSVGLTKKGLKNGFPWAFLIGLLMIPAQLLFSRQRETIWDLLTSGKFFLLFPIVFLLMFLTAGFTEEFFFRGILQTRFTLLLRSDFRAVLLTSFLFAVYHLPYAYLLEQWPSHGNLQLALITVFVEGFPTGIVLGFLYARSKNLLAPIFLHSIINAIVGVTFIKFG